MVTTLKILIVASIYCNKNIFFDALPLFHIKHRVATGSKPFHSNKVFMTDQCDINYRNGFLSSFGIRIDARTLSKKEFQGCFECSWPVVLTNVFDVDNEWWTEQLLSRLGDRDVNFDIRQSEDGNVETFEAPLSDFIGSLLDESSHESSWYLMDEDLLLDEELLCSKLALPTRLFSPDLFQHFPEEIRPRTALIVGGEGARSFLHADPYEWTGWNYLLEGRKLCKPRL